MKAELPPVEHEVWVPLAVDEAFALFTQQLAAWWPLASHSCSGHRGATVTIEPRGGGAVTEHAPDGTAHAWGTLTEWSPPDGFAMHWHPAQPPEAATLLRVRFIAQGGGTRVAVHHGGWSARGDGAEAVREGYQRGWPMVLGCFVDPATAASRRGDHP